MRKVKLYVQQFLTLAHFKSEKKLKYDPEDDEEADTLSFNLRNTFFFDKNATYPLTGKEIVTIPHMIMMVRFTLIIYHLSNTLTNIL